MDENSVVIILIIKEVGVEVDLEIPLNISANELFVALNEAYHLDKNTSDIKRCYLKAENPIALLKGDKLLSSYGIRNGTKIYMAE